MALPDRSPPMFFEAAPRRGKVGNVGKAGNVDKAGKTGTAGKKRRARLA